MTGSGTSGTGRHGFGVAPEATGERKFVSVLFVDLADSYRILDSLDVDAVGELLDCVLDYMCAAVERHGGSIATRLGDGVMGVFGAPRAIEAHEVRAVQAALDIHADLDRLKARMPALAAPRFYTSVHSGEVLAKSSPHAETLPEVLGKTVFLASRLNKIGGPGVVTVTGEVAAKLGDVARLERMGTQRVRGRVKTVEIFRVHGLDTSRLELHGARPVSFSPFVGRNRELERLEGRLRRAADGAGGIVAVVGEAGLGKSRLLFEMRRVAGRLGAVVARGRCSDFGRSLAYQPFRNMIELLLGGAAEVPEALRTRIVQAMLGDEDRRLAIQSVLGRLPSDSPWQSYDASRKQSLIRQSILEVMKSMAAEAPTLIEIEDVHWIDAESRGLLDLIAAQLAALRVLIVVTSRRSERTAAERSFVDEEIVLPALETEDVAAIATDRLAPNAVSADALRQIEELAGGNPLFVEECARLLDAHARQPDASAPLPGAASPPALTAGTTIQSIIAARLDELPAEARRVLVASSAIGTRFGLDVLERIVEMPRARLDASIDVLLQAELIFPTRSSAPSSFRFKHFITREVAYRSMTKRMCETCHARVLAAYEAIHGERTGEFADVLKEHARIAGALPAAISYQRISALAALERSANAECLALLEECRTMAAELPQTRDVVETRIDLCFELRNVLEIIKPGGISAILREAGELAASIGDDRREGLAASYMTHALWVESRFDAALEYGARAIATGRRLDVPEIWIPALYHSALVLLGMGRHAEASARFDEVVGAVETTQLRSRFRLNVAPATLARSYRARCLAEMACFEEAGHEARRALEDADAERGRYATAFAELALGHIEICRDEPAAAIPWLERSVDGFRASDATVMGPVSEAFLGYAMAGTGRAAEAVPLLERAVAASRASEVWEQLSLRTMFLSEAHLAAGDLQRAQGTLEIARELAVSQSEGPSAAYVDWQSVRLRLAAGGSPTPEDAALLRSVIARCGEMDMHALAAKCRRLLEG